MGSCSKTSKPAPAIHPLESAKKEMGPSAYSTCPAGSCLITQSLGANFVLYGPIENAEAVFPACAMADAIIAYNARRFGIDQRPGTIHFLKFSNYPPPTGQNIPIKTLSSILIFFVSLDMFFAFNEMIMPSFT